MRTVFRLAAALLAAAFSFTTAASTPKYIFLFIGDGMGVQQRMLTEEYCRAVGDGKLAMNHLPYSALTRTCSANSLITDSAAAATAIACGVKTNNRMLGVAPTDGNPPVESCAEVAHRLGFKVGIATTVYLTHATPGGFYSHRSSRAMTDGVAFDLGRSGFEYFAGGGLHLNIGKFAPRCEAAYNYIHTNGYLIVSNRTDFLALKPGSGKIFTRFTDGCLTAELDATDLTRAHEPTLEEIVVKGIELLDNERGFFFMCEGGTIDWVCHGSDGAAVIAEVRMLDRCVRRALEFQAQHPDETLVIVTGDHETGGLSMGYTPTGYRLDPTWLRLQRYSALTFDGLVEQRFLSGELLDANAVKAFVTAAFSLRFDGDAKQDPLVLTPDERKEIEEAIEHDLAALRAKIAEDERYDAAKRYQLGGVCRSILSHKCGVAWGTKQHSGIPVLTTATGCGAERFQGFIENTDIAMILKGFFEAASDK